MSSHTKYPDDTDEIPVVDASRPPSDYRPKSDAGPAPAGTDKIKIDLSLSQILGGGLAAATAAAVGSKLGVAGTIGGAAVASIVTAVAASVYTASVRRTKAGVKNVFTKKTSIGEAAPVIRQGTADWATSSATETLPASPQVASPSISTSTSPAVAQTPPKDHQPSIAAERPEPVRGRWAKLAWKRIAVGAIAVFVLASVVIFGFERVTGQALDGEKGTTTFGQVAQSERTSNPSPSSSSSDEPSSEASGQSSAEPSSSTSSEPSGNASAEPSSGASVEASGQPSSEPSASAPSSEPSNGTSTDPSASSQPSAGAESAVGGQSESGQNG